MFSLWILICGTLILLLVLYFVNRNTTKTEDLHQDTVENDENSMPSLLDHDVISNPIVGLSNPNLTDCFMNVSVQVLYHSSKFRKALNHEIMGNFEQNEEAVFLDKLLTQMDDSETIHVDLPSFGLEYHTNLTWFVEGEFTDVSFTLNKLLGAVSDTSLRPWYGGIMDHNTLFPTGSAAHVVPQEQVPFTMLVYVVENNSTLQGLLDSNYSVGQVNLSNTTSRDLGREIKYETVAKLPKILTIQIVRERTPGTSANKFYHSMKYPATIDLTACLSNPIPGQDHKFHLVNVVARQSNLKKGESSGHFITACSSQSSAADPVQWHLYNDELVTLITESDALVFTGEKNTYHSGDRDCRENRFYADILIYVDEQCLAEFYGSE